MPKTYYALHDTYLAAGHFVGKDQSLMGSVAVQHMEKTLILDTRRLSACGDPWFSFQPFLASATECPEDCHWQCQQSDCKSLRATCPNL